MPSSLCCWRLCCRVSAQNNLLSVCGSKTWRSDTVETIRVIIQNIALRFGVLVFANIHIERAHGHIYIHDAYTNTSSKSRTCFYISTFKAQQHQQQQRRWRRQQRQQLLETMPAKEKKKQKMWYNIFNALIPICRTICSRNQYEMIYAHNTSSLTKMHRKQWTRRIKKTA